MEEFNQSENVSSEIPMTSPSEAEYEYQAVGKTVKEPISQILKRASQGYDYAQKMNDYNSRMNELNTNYKLYQEIDSYAKTNPGWWDHISKSYTSRQNDTSHQNDTSLLYSANNNSYVSPTAHDPYASKFEKIESFINDYTSEKRAQEREKADNALKEEIEGIKKQYGNLDFNHTDESGKSLEKRVLEHAVNNGIKSFKTAFRDFYHEELVKRAELDGKSRAAQEMQKNAKIGLLGRTDAPTKELNTPSNIRNTSYSDLTSLALKELGI
jgi:hypothetical protein